MTLQTDGRTGVSQYPSFFFEKCRVNNLDMKILTSLSTVLCVDCGVSGGGGVGQRF